MLGLSTRDATADVVAANECVPQFLCRQHDRIVYASKKAKGDQSSARVERDTPKEARRQLIGQKHVVLPKGIYALGVRESGIEPPAGRSGQLRSSLLDEREPGRRHIAAAGDADEIRY
jgi:hypothetical protein